MGHHVSIQKTDFMRMRQTCFASMSNALVLLALSPAGSVYDFFVGTFGLALQGRTVWVELPVAVLIVLSPVACLILFVISLRRTGSPSLRQRIGDTAGNEHPRRSAAHLPRDRARLLVLARACSAVLDLPSRLRALYPPSDDRLRIKVPTTSWAKRYSPAGSTSSARN
jgi:hypothetical protein